MKRKTLLILSCILLTIQAMAQSENKKEVLTKEKKQTTLDHERSNHTIQPIGVDARLMLPDQKGTNASFDTIATALRLKLPTQHQGNSAAFPFYKKIFLYVEGEQKRYLNLANYNLAYMALGWRFNSKLNVTGGLLAIKQFSNHLPSGIDRSGVRFKMNYAITNQLDLNIWGQYIAGSSIYSPVDNLLQQTGTGASMVLNLGGGSQFGVGAEYQKDDKKEKWNYNAGGKLKLNF